MDFEKYFQKIAQNKVKAIDECDLETFIRNSIHEFNMTSKAFSNFWTLIYDIFKYAKRKKYVLFSITYTLNDMDISPKAFKPVVRQAKDQVYMPDEKKDGDVFEKSFGYCQSWAAIHVQDRCECRRACSNEAC